MKQKLLKIVTVVMLIMTLTLANFLLLCVNVVSYAIAASTNDNSTNHKNIEFRAYLKNDEGDKVSNLDITANKENVKLYLQIALKNQGYFNGSITLDEANFKLIPENNSSDINKIEGNTIYLNQINAGESKELEVILRWENKEENLGTRMSTVKIEETENSANFKETNEKDNEGTVSIVIGIKTGETVSIVIIGMIMVALVICSYITIRTIRKKDPEIKYIKFLK